MLAIGPLVLGASLPAQAASSAGFKLVARSVHVDYWSEGRERVDVASTERFLARLDSVFGAPPEGWRIDYYRHASRAALRERVGLPASGVTDLVTGRVDSVRDFHPHELVHAVMARIGHPPVLIAEGLAVAMTSRGLWGDQEFDRLAAREMAARRSLEPFLSAFTEQDPEVGYAVAGSFVAFLIDRHGIEPMLAFLRGCAGGSQRYERAFRGAYGRTLARASIEWMAALDRADSPGKRAWYEPETWPESLRARDPLLAAAGVPPIAIPVMGAAVALEPAIAAERGASDAAFDLDARAGSSVVSPSVSPLP